MAKYTEFDQALANEICLAISSSTCGIRKLCAKNPHWPDRSTIYRWTWEYPKEFGDHYAHAKARQVEWLVEEALEIAYDGSHDTYIDERGNDRCDHEWLGRSRLKIDTIKWLACKLAPKIYGDKLEEKSDPANDPDILRAKNSVQKLKATSNGQSSPA